MQADEFIQADFQNRIGDDLIGGAGRAVPCAQVEMFASKQNFISKGIKIAIQNLLAADKEVCHLVYEAVSIEL